MGNMGEAGQQILTISLFGMMNDITIDAYPKASAT